MAQPWNDDNAYDAHDIDAWIAIDPDDSILIRYQRSEMGQGSMTALPMIVTEELQCDWAKVRVEYASPNRSIRENKVYGDMFSHGSVSVRQSQKKDAAGRRQRARTPHRGRCDPMERAGIGMHGRFERGDAWRFGPHAAVWRVGRPMPQRSRSPTEPAIKTPDKFTFIGKPMPRIDVVHKIDGSAKFGIDAQVPGHGFRRDQCVPGAGRQAQERR